MDKDKQKNTPMQISSAIENSINEDIDKLLSEQRLDLKKDLDTQFDSYEVYEKIMESINQREKLKRKNRIVNSYRWALGSIALFILLGVGYTLWSGKTLQEPVYQELYAEKGDKLIVVLPDGSKVWLNSDSKLSYSSNFNEKSRNVILDGEAYFEVAKNKKRPFKVQTDKIAINVLGTSFNVSAYSSDDFIKTTLDEGSIVVEDLLDKNKQFTMVPKQTTYYEKANQEYSIVENQYSSEMSSWRFNRFAFRNATLKEVLKTLNRKFDVEFIVEDPQLEKYTYTFTSKLKNLEDILYIMKSITPIKIDKRGNVLSVSRLQ